MSKRWIGRKRYEDGTQRFTYFRIEKHHRCKTNGWTRFRWMMYVAKGWQLDKQIYKKYYKN
jgi:hypothetical protein